MAGLKELRTRIETIKSTQKITSAMKMVAASRLRRVQNLVDKNQGYSENLRQSALRVLMEIRQEEKEKNIHYILPELLAQRASAQNYLLLVFSSDRGLCGAFNGNIIKRASARIKELQRAGKNIQVRCFGKKAYDGLKRIFSEDNLSVSTDEHFLEDASYPTAAKKISDYILQNFAEKNFDICEAVYARFSSAISRDFVCEQLCPMNLNTQHLSDEQLQKINRVGQAFYEYLPDKLSVLSNILPILFNDNIFKVIVNSAASEHGARMSSMDNATRNAKKMISELTLRYNSLRQSAITTELIEIIAGAEAI